ncbi:proline racemase family protein [Haloarculaceae archaeon H-GB2-1]|nr:proline racemase family protein [Haloarculaceae archaeon H-GB1-1]MEA5388014.1 proline racemase family protein [Haloarculaceae archaeon H-GB11]MEA5409501.1 proline racemase family protein [Haloarculaceae archaeon H-GB2-1]
MTNESAPSREVPFETIETHTAGEPTRIVVDGLDEFVPDHGSVREKMRHFEDHHDWVRRLLMQEPRGHADMYGAFPVEPQAPEADLGVFFAHVSSTGDMCGHATIGLVTALIETGRLEPADEITLETPAGLVRAYPVVEDGTVTEVSMRNVEAFVYDDVEVRLDDVGAVDVDVVSSGEYFAMVSVDDIGVDIEPENIPELRSLSEQLHDRINDRLDFEHPFREARPELQAVEFYRSATGGGPEGRDVDRNTVIFGDRVQVDRSPCGTGTCAKAALKYTQGDIGLDEEFVHESVIDTRFRSRVVDAEQRDGYTVVTPEVTGDAHIIGEHTFVKRPDDPVNGFTV